MGAWTLKRIQEMGSKLKSQRADVLQLWKYLIEEMQKDWNWVPLA